ncbi:MAG: hypothetical protein IT381_15295 [Deltaproteobacteria bacterium]|nr:hypothetical protein [Deltaproteobacteria bacterium]
MLALDGKIEVHCTLDEAWDLFCRFGDVAKLIPSVEHVEVSGDTVNGRVGVHLGKLFVSSRITLQVTERKPFACLKAQGVSYLGETIRTQVTSKDVGIDKESVGQLRLHLDLRAGEQIEQTWVIFHAEVEAEGRLRRIYESILKNKAPAMMDEFAVNIKRTLEAETPAVPLAPVPPAVPAIRRRPWFARFFAWLRRWLSPSRKGAGS